MGPVVGRGAVQAVRSQPGTSQALGEDAGGQLPMNLMSLFSRTPFIYIFFSFNDSDSNLEKQFSNAEGTGRHETQLSLRAPS